MPILTRRLAVVCAVASVAMLGFSSWWGFLAVNLVLAAVALTDAALATSPDLIGVEREVPEIIALDAVGEITWRLSNPAGRRLVVDFADDLAPSLRARTRRARVTIPGGRTVDVRTPFRPARRGRFDIDELVVRVEGPLGLAARQRARHRVDTLRVYPPFRSKDEAELRIKKAQMLEIGLRTAQGRGGGTEFDQLREFTTDDEFKKIDWSATARAGKTIVRTYRAERNQTVISLLDNGRVMAARVDDVPKVEHAMDAVMMITAVSTRLGDRAGLVAFDSAVRAVVPPGHGRHQLSRVTEAMYALEPQLAESDYLAAFTETLARFRRRAMLIVYTDLVEQALAETLLPALPMIARSHVVVVASVQDPDVVRWADLRPETEVDAYRQAAAITSLEERRRITARLRGFGATIVDAPPGLLAPQLADVYLKIKATGRL
jgi:uncharacterized protein (DUF58 family)